MTEGITIGFAVGFVAMLCIGFSCRKNKPKDLIIAPPPPPPPPPPRSKYPNCRVGEMVYVKYPDVPGVFLVEVVAINADGVIVNDPNAEADKQLRFYAHKNIFRTYKKEGIENE